MFTEKMFVEHKLNIQNITNMHLNNVYTVQQQMKKKRFLQ